MEKTLTKSTDFRGSLLTLEVHEVELQDGSTSRREIVRHPGAVCCVVLRKDGRTALVRQYRKAIEAMTLEIPAGQIDPGESPQTTVVRELQEEVGYRSGEIRHLMDFYCSPGFCDENLSLYLATDVEVGEQSLDEGEFLELEWLPFEEAVEMALTGKLGDAKSVAGILATDRLLTRG